VRHLQLIAVALDAPRDVAHFADGQLAFDVGPLGVEEDEIEPPGLVLGRDLVGGLAIAFRWSPVPDDAHSERGDGSRHGRRHRWFRAPVDDAGRQVPKEIEHARLAYARRQSHGLLQEAGQPRPDPLERLRRGEQL
jgi:hypothetical protein